MRIAPLSLLLTAALIGAPATAASADPAPAAQVMPAASVTTAPPSVSDAERYAARETKDASVSNFQGGGEVIYVGGGAVTLVLVLLLFVIVF